MLTLFDSLEEVEGRHAEESELRLVHTPEYISRVRSWVDDARQAERPIEIRPGLLASGATWDASLAAVGSVLRAIDVVRTGTTQNAFCPIRPAARDAGVDEPGSFGFFNQIAVAVRYLTSILEGSVLVVLWGDPNSRSLARIFASDDRVLVVEVAHAGARSALLPNHRSEPKEGHLLADATRRALESVSRHTKIEFVLLSASFDFSQADAESERDAREDYFAATGAIKDFADSVCEGRLVSVLEGGYSQSLGHAIVVHLRSLAELDLLAV